MSGHAPGTWPGLPARQRLLLLAAALVAVLVAVSGGPALASGALPWLAPGQQANASAVSPPGSNATSKPDPKPAAIPDDAAALAQYEVLRQYFRRQITLAEDLPLVFSRRVRDGETVAFLSMVEMQRRRGLLARFRAAEVDLSGLTFTRVTADPDLARIRVTGRYSFSMPPQVQETMEEDALFVLLPELGEWKIFERREGWRP